MKDLTRHIFLNYAVSFDTLNRFSAKRKNEDWINEKLVDPITEFIPIWQNKNLVSKDKPRRMISLTGADLTARNIQRDSAVFLGEMNDKFYFAIQLPSENETEAEPPVLEFLFSDLKNYAPLLRPEDCALMAYAGLMINWHNQTRYCGVCGSKTISTEAGHVLKCSSEQCGKLHFPRTDIAVIALITNGDECLLARQPWWGNKLYSLLAGYVEPAETFEDALEREVFEETGLRLASMEYVASQPWPFSNSVMIGYNAVAVDKSVKLDNEELEDARWFTRDDIKSELKDGKITLPSPTSISYYLIERWFDKGKCGLLKELLTK